RILAERFFPPPVSADMSDMARTADQNLPDQRIWIEEKVTTFTIQEIIQRLPDKKAPGPDGITNEVLKLCSSEIASHLADIARACFTMGYHPKEFWRTITVVLRKERKPNSPIPGRSAPIPLRNTIGKALKNQPEARF